MNKLILLIQENSIDERINSNIIQIVEKENYFNDIANNIEKYLLIYGPRETFNEYESIGDYLISLTDENDKIYYFHNNNNNNSFDYENNKTICDNPKNINYDNTENKLYYEKDIEYILKVKVEIICFIWCSTDNVEICSLENENNLIDLDIEGANLNNHYINFKRNHVLNSGIRPNYSNIIKSFIWLISGLSKEDYLFLYYFGYGRNVKDKSNDESNFYDKTIILLDYQEKRHIIYDIIKEKLI
ncbi:hypothetical protein U3516DRAFT_740410 [Neocallimastix sp. 'constans']